MSKLSLSIFLNAYSDSISTNAPGKNNFRWNKDVQACIVNNPISESAIVVPGDTLSLFNGTRVLDQDSTTVYSLSAVPFTTNTYQLTATSGTLPNFRTPRSTGADATTQVNVTLNGSVVTFTSGSGTYASYTGALPGMLSSVTITANSVGTAGNSVVLTGNGTSSISTLITAWNTANPSNQVTLTSGNGNQIPNTGSAASFTGTILGTSSPVTITANNSGTIGNSVVLTGYQTSSINTLISNWNTANPSNQITLTSGDGTQIPTGGAYSFYTDTPTGCSTSVTLTAQTIGEVGNGIQLIGDSVSSIATLIANWNSLNPSNQVTLTSGNGGQIPNFGAFILLANGVNPAVVRLAGGVSSSLQLSGGVSATAFNLSGVQIGDNVIIGSNFNPLNQGTFSIIAFTSNSFSVVNSTGIAEGPILLGSGFATQVQIFSMAGVQVNDTIIISGGFSPVTQGSYKITQVAANSLQFYSTAVLPQQTGIMTEDINIYSAAKNLIYLESDSKVSVIINGINACDIEPFIMHDCIKPGVFMLKSTVYSLSLMNSGINSANIFFASVE